MARCLLALLLAAALAPAAPAHDPLQAIDECLARLDTELDVGYARIAARCPDLTPALARSTYAPWLPTDWHRPDNELSAAGLSELRAQLLRVTVVPAPAHGALRSADVAAVLAQVTHVEASPRSGGWQRFKDWFRRLIAAHPPGDDAWLGRWLADLKLPGGVTELIGWAALGAVVLLAAGILVNELRIAGLLRRRSDCERSPSAAGGRGRAASGPADLEHAPLEEQPARLLELIAERLAVQRPLPPTRALTARELERKANLQERSARARLAELVAVCERVRFSPERVSDTSLAAALRAGRELLLALEQAASAGRRAAARGAAEAA